MISRLSGVIVEVSRTPSIVVDVSGVGYEVVVSTSLAAKCHVGSQVVLAIRMITRDDGSVLFGFEDPRERGCFDELRTVQGVGPQLALSIVSALGTDLVYRSVSLGDPSTFRQVSGVGARLSERLVLEMKRFVPDVVTAGPIVDGEVVDGGVVAETRAALEALGFSAKEIAEVEVDFNGVGGVEEAVRLALRKLSR